MIIGYGWMVLRIPASGSFEEAEWIRGKYDEF